MSVEQIGALITGASTGIGATYADRLTRRGYDLVLVARDAARMEALAERLRSETGRAIEVLPADLTKEIDLARVEARIAKDESIDLLVNNAGMSLNGSLLDNGPAEFSRIIGLNVTAPTRLASAAAKAFVARGRGAIVNLSSVTAFAPERFDGVYSGSKVYLLNLSLSLAAQTRDHGVHVQAVVPGATRTEIWARSGKDVDAFPPEWVMGRRSRRCRTGRLRQRRDRHDPAARRRGSISRLRGRAIGDGAEPVASHCCRALSDRRESRASAGRPIVEAGISHHISVMPSMPNICNNLALRKAGRNLGVLYDEAIAPSGLRGGQFSILAHVHALERPTMKELANELVMDLSALGHTLKPLERDGFVALVANELDGRSKRVVLTKVGAAKLREAAELWRAAQDRFERAFGATKAKRMRDMLALLASDDFSVAFRSPQPSK